MTELPKLLWQREYNHRWCNYSAEECGILNKAVDKGQKTVTLPSTDPKKKLNINLEKMYQKNLISGYEQRIRCILYSNKYYCWTWRDDFDDIICYTPRISCFLEIAYQKKIGKVDILLKDEYEIDLHDFTQRNKNSGYIRSISRDEVEVPSSLSSKNEHVLSLEWNIKCQDFITLMSAEDEQRIKSVLFDTPILREESEDLQVIPATDERINALNAEAQAHRSICPSSVPVDPLCPKAENWHVYCEGTDIYHATLNFTSLQANNNKFYSLQLLEFNNKKKYAVWIHWGRVGYKGQVALHEFSTNFNGAKEMFLKKFYDKTRNNFEERSNFQRVPTKYDLVDTDLTSQDFENPEMPETKLDKRIQMLLELICNKKTLEAAAKDMAYDCKAIPLGKITAKQIADGYTAIKNVAEVLQSKGVCKELVEACNVFYTKIPHDFGRKTPPMLSNMDAVREKLKMLEALSNICLAMNFIGANDSLENPIDTYYRSLDCTLIPIEHDSEEFKTLIKCIKETHGPSHAYTIEVEEVYMCVKEEEFINHGNNKLLWHGSRLSNWISILKKGLQIAPPEAPSTGYMFGKGIYFADVPSKSANYCYATKKNNEGLLLLSEVSLGKELEVYHAEDLSDLSSISDGAYKSVLGVGKLKPSNFQRSILSSEALIPFGPLEESGIEDLSLNYNEYIIYNVNQVKLKYLLKIKFYF